MNIAGQRSPKLSPCLATGSDCYSHLLPCTDWRWTVGEGSPRTHLCDWSLTPRFSPFYTNQQHKNVSLIKWKSVFNIGCIHCDEVKPDCEQHSIKNCFCRELDIPPAPSDNHCWLFIVSHWPTSTPLYLSGHLLLVCACRWLSTAFHTHRCVTAALDTTDQLLRQEYILKLWG